ncbi:MAG: hypothetical protein ACTSQ5_07230 [Promethearchaeota archaeon]
MPENTSQYALRGEYGLYEPILIQFYHYSTNAIGISLTRLIFVNIGGYTVFVVYKGIHLGFEKKKIHIAKNLQKVATKRGLTVK